MEAKQKGLSQMPLPASTTPTTRVWRWHRLGIFMGLCAIWVLLHYRSGYPEESILEAHDEQLVAAFAPRRPLRGVRAIKEFLTVPNNESALAASRLYATKPHMAGTPQDFVTALDVLELFQKEFRIPARDSPPVYQAGSAASRLATLTIPWSSQPRVWIDTYYPMMNTPLDRALEIIDEDGKVAWSASLEEVADAEDPDAAKYWASVPTFHGLSRSGDVKGPLIYANYGTKEDYDALVQQGVDFTGAIVLVRYGAIFRGLKIKGAQELGAAGVLIYSDLRDDGSVTEKNGYAPYPDGPARNAHSVQRGSVQFISMYPGDPTTPGKPSYANTTRTEALNIPSIPSLPISWANAHHLLSHFRGGAVKANITVRLRNNVDDKVTPIWNTMALIPGHIKDEIVVIGNHRDAWVLGATDPSSGTSSMHEVIKGFAHIYRKGWRPLRSILFASWDAEEYGLIGSTEFGEDFPHFLSHTVVAYLNLDSSVSGSRFHMSGSPSLANLLRTVSQHISHPTEPGRSLWDARQDRGTLDGVIDNDVEAMHAAAEARTSQVATGVNPLGSGSDYTVFLQRIGIASADGGFASTLKDAVYHYHSIYDSQRWQELYGDPGFHRHVAVSKFLGTTALAISDSIVLPINTTQYAADLGLYLQRVENIAVQLDDKPDLSELRDAIINLQEQSSEFDDVKQAAEKELKKVLRGGHGRRLVRNLKWKARRLAGWFSAKVFGMSGSWKCHEQNVDGYHQFSSQQDWIESHDTDRVDELASVIVLDERPVGMPVADEKPRRRPRNPIKLIHAIRRVRAVNKKLAMFEKSFISEEGIKDREWYKHLAVAPGKWLGYGATTFPALTESLTIDKNVTLANLEAARLTNLINKAAAALKK